MVSLLFLVVSSEYLKKKGCSDKTLTEAHDCFTTKEDEAFEPFLKFGDIEVHQETVFTPTCILRVLRALRGKFSLVSITCNPKLKKSSPTRNNKELYFPTSNRVELGA
jgi:hypothetical protein